MGLVQPLKSRDLALEGLSPKTCFSDKRHQKVSLAYIYMQTDDFLSHWIANWHQRCSCCASNNPGVFGPISCGCLNSTCCRWNPCVFNDIANVNVYAILMVFTILMVYVLHDIANTNCFSNVHAILPVLYYLFKPPCLPGSGGKVARRVQSISSYWRPVVNCFINLSVAIASLIYSQTSQAQKHQAIWKQTRPRDASIPGETHCHKATVWRWFIAPT